MDLYANSKRLKDVLREQPTSFLSEKANKIATNKFIVHSQTKFRNEEFGALVYRANPLALVLVNHSTARFLKIMSEKKEIFDLSVFLEQSGAKTESESRSVKHLYQKLVYKEFLVALTK